MMEPNNPLDYVAAQRDHLGQEVSFLLNDPKITPVANSFHQP